MNSKLKFKLVKPEKSLKDFVYAFSSLQNLSQFNDGVIIPNGRIDLIFSKNTKNEFQVSLMGLEIEPKLIPKQRVSAFFSISFNPLGAEYILQESVANIVNKGKHLSNDFWEFNINDLNDFKKFCHKAVRKIKSLLPNEIDERKRRLFEMIFASHGEIAIQHIADHIGWSQRQINRYFNKQFGISLKAYCNILRFQASLPHIKAGRLSPQLNFTDQSHLIKEIKQLSGVSPKELSRNKNDRFLQFLAVDAE